MTSKRNFGRSGPKNYYFVLHSDVPKLKAWLSKVGFKFDPVYGPNMNIYERHTSSLGQFRPDSQRAVIWNDVDPRTDRQVFELYLENEF